MRKLLLIACLASAACSGNSTAPSTTTTAPPPATPTTFNLSGTVSSTTGGAIAGATVRILDGANAGKSTTTNSGGTYSFAGLAQSGMTVNAAASFYSGLSKGVTLTSSQTVDFQLAPIPLFSISGVGNTVFDVPTTVSRIRIIADYGGSCSNFIAHIGGRTVVNEILGSCSISVGRHYDAIALTTGGTGDVVSSTGVAWSFTEVRQ